MYKKKCVCVYIYIYTYIYIFVDLGWDSIDTESMVLGGSVSRLYDHQTISSMSDDWIRGETDTHQAQLTFSLCYPTQHIHMLYH